MTWGLITSVKFRGFNEEKPVQGPTDAVPTACFCRSSPWVSSVGHPEEKENELKRTCAPELQEAMEKRRNGQVCAVEQSL